MLTPDWRSCPAGARRFSTTTSHSLGSNIPSAEDPLDEASTRVQAIHPSGLPLARRRPDGTSSRFGFPPSFAPRRPGAGQRTSRVGTGHRARTQNNALRHRPSLQSNVVHSWCATSRRTDQGDTQRRFAAVKSRTGKRSRSTGRRRNQTTGDPVSGGSVSSWLAPPQRRMSAGSRTRPRCPSWRRRRSRGRLPWHFPAVTPFDHVSKAGEWRVVANRAFLAATQGFLQR